MTKLALALAVLLAAPLARADEPGPAAPKAAPKRAAPAGKPRPPVRVDAAVEAGTARVTVTFDAAASGVSVRVYGARGLEVTSATPEVGNADVQAGETRELEVRFTAPEGRSHLAVQVAGRFPGAARSAVFSFPVGEPSAAQRAEKSRGVRKTESGERVKTLPGQER